ncbi:subtilisin-like protease SBT2.4 [Spinacia oleracea]|uniref:Subtilisin-like protease SBT2.4 n=1 Tax=Spinacia oleracea TaxID=3562 RepID=A0ABM3QUS2_SPIOL|nr:subtilisin-like protease SBT2.4 [Spinacia oleracea]
MLLEKSHNQLLQSTLDIGTYNKLHSFTHLANGFAVHTTPSQAEKLKNSPTVKLVVKDRGVKLMTTYTPEFLKLPQTVWDDDEQEGNKNAGEGIVIGFVDSGINPFHPSFADDDFLSINTTLVCSNSSRFCGACETGPRFPASSCNGKIVSARFFAAGAQAAALLNASVDFLSPFDAVGHGSHVASTAAGNSRVPVVVDGFFYGTASGMAPRARIAVYKAIYPTVGTLTDVLAAIDQAVKDGVDILNLSVEPDEPGEDTITFLDVFEIFTLLARRAGVFVVQAAGNKGPDPSSVVSFSPWSVGVAACSTDRSYPATLFLGNGQKIAGVGLSGPTFGNGILKYKLVLAKDAVYINGSFPRTSPYIEECQFPEALDPVVVAGSIVICNFSDGFYNQTSSLTSIINTAKMLGFMGFILAANPAYGDFVAEPVPFPVPGIMIPKTADAKIMSQYYEERTKRSAQGCVIKYNARASIGEGRMAFFDRQAAAVSRFSSRGPDIIDSHRNPADVLKPDFVAPGQQIWAAWSPLSALEPIFKGNDFAMMSGTSMAAPHIAGIAALIKQHNPSWTPSMIASAISTTATKYDNSRDIILSEGFDLGSFYPSTPFDIGAGLVNPARAIDPGLTIIPGEGEYVAFLCSLPNINKTEVEVMTGGSCNHPLAHPADLNLPSVTITSLIGSQLVRRNVTNVGNKQETYLCAVLPPIGVTVDVSPTWFTIAPTETQDLEIKLNVTQANKDFSFGEIVLTGSLDHIVRMPLSVLPVSVS